MNKVKVQTFNFKDQKVKDETVDFWSLDEVLENVLLQFAEGWLIKKIILEKVKA